MYKYVQANGQIMSYVPNPKVILVIRYGAGWIENKRLYDKLKLTYEVHSVYDDRYDRYPGKGRDGRDLSTCKLDADRATDAP